MYLPTEEQRAEMARLDRRFDLYGRLALGFAVLSAALWVLYFFLTAAAR